MCQTYGKYGHKTGDYKCLDDNKEQNDNDKAEKND